MKKILYFIAIILFINYTYSQELIKNNGFEQGTIPIYTPDYTGNFPENVPYWRQGCDTDPITGYLFTPDIHTVGSTICYWNAPNNNHTQNLAPRITGTNRYVKCVRGVNTSANPNYSIRESIIGELIQPLTAGTYNVSLYGSKIKGRGYCNNSITTFPSSDPGATIEVVLRKSTDLCNSSSPVMWTSSQINTIGSWQQSGGSFVIDCAAAAKGYDRIEFRMKDINGVNGFFIDDVSLKKADINPIINVSKFYCSNTPLTFSGSIPSGENSLTHMWEIQECNYNGTILIGSPLHNQWLWENPSPYTFPSSLNLPCNKYYRVKLATSNNVSCEWVESSKVIYLNCAPTLNPIPNQTICNGDSASFTISTSNWPVQVYNGASLVGTFYSNPITLSPTLTTNYTFKVTNGAKYSCSTTQSATITVKNCPRACFSIKNIYSQQTEPSLYGPTSVKILCLPQIEIDGSCSTNEQGYHIRIAEFNLNSWQFIPADYYSGWVGSGTAPNSINLTSLISTPSANNGWTSRSFDPTKLYIVTFDVGPTWHSAPAQFFRVQNCISVSLENFKDDKTNTTINIYPNPTKDNITITVGEFEKIISYTIYDSTGFTVDLNSKFHSESNTQKINLSNLRKGLYIINIETDKGNYKKQFIKE